LAKDYGEIGLFFFLVFIEMIFNYFAFTHSVYLSSDDGISLLEGERTKEASRDSPLIFID
jgi:hypothetical protein